MITEYHRPDTLEAALELLARTDIPTLPIGGGTALDRSTEKRYAVVDLQGLGLSSLRRRGNTLEIGATLPLQALLDYADLPAVLKRAVELEASYNLRQVGTVAGTLVAAGGRSPLATVMLALDAHLFTRRSGTDSEENILYGDLLALRGERLNGRLITMVKIPMNAGLAYEYVARTPADQPLVCAAVARWPSGRTRLALGGFGKAPILALDGPEPGGLDTAARSAYETAGDQWASAEYRRETAAVLARRGLESLTT